MDSSVSLKDEIWFLRMCHHISNAVYVYASRRYRRTKHACAERPVNGQVESADLIPWVASLNFISMISVCLPAKNNGLQINGSYWQPFHLHVNNIYNFIYQCISNLQNSFLSFQDGDILYTGFIKHSLHAEI